MKYRKMGSLGWDVSALGFGAMRLPTGIVGNVNEKESIKIIRRGIDLGINYVDTGFPYHLGEGEKVVGKALKDGYREKVRLATKLPMMLVRKEADFESRQASLRGLLDETAAFRRYYASADAELLINGDMES